MASQQLGAASHFGMICTRLRRGEVRGCLHSAFRGVWTLSSATRRKLAVGALAAALVWYSGMMTPSGSRYSLDAHHRHHFTKGTMRASQEAAIASARPSTPPAREREAVGETLSAKGFSMKPSGPFEVAPGAYLFKNVCVTFNIHNTLERTERGLIWFDKTYDQPKRCVPCSNPLLSYTWQEPSYRDYFGAMGPGWEAEGGLLRDVRKGEHGCGMMWMQKITVHDLDDYNQCMQRHRKEIRDRGQTQRPSKAKTVKMYSGRTLLLNWYHRNIGHQLFDSMTSLMPLLRPAFLAAATGSQWPLPYENVVAHQLPKCDDSFYICNILRRLGLFRGVGFVPLGDENTITCFKEIVVPRSGYYGRQGGTQKIPGFAEFRQALFRAYGLSARRAAPFPVGPVPRPVKPRLLFYRHAATRRRVWLGLEPTKRALAKIFQIDDVYDFGKLTLKQQAEYFSRSDLLLMAHGAQFANVIFCSPGAHVYEISCNGYSHVGRALPPSRYGVHHHSVSNVVCNYEGVPDKLDANFTFPVAELMQMLVKDEVLELPTARMIVTLVNGQGGSKVGSSQDTKVVSLRQQGRALGTGDAPSGAEPKPNRPKDPKPQPQPQPKPPAKRAKLVPKSEDTSAFKKQDEYSSPKAVHAPITDEYELERWKGRFDMRYRHVLNASCDELPRIVPRYGAYRRVGQHVRDWAGAEKGKPRILCWAFTRKGFEKRARAIQQTWGLGCDRLLLVSNAHMENLDTMVVGVQDGDSHDNLWRKLSTSIRAIWKRFSGQYDWFYKVDDDTYVMTGNLRKYLLSKTVTDQVEKGKGVYIGRHMDSRTMLKGKGGGCRFNVGGGGYLLDGVAMELLHDKIGDCFPDKRTSADDMFLGCCLEKHGVLPMDTRDALGGERFHPFDPQFCMDYTLPKDKEKAMREDWFYSYSLKPLKERLQHCAKDSIAFHHMPPHYFYQIHKLWFECPQLLK